MRESIFPKCIDRHAKGHVSVDGVPLAAAALSEARSGEPTQPAIIAFDPSICDMGYAVLRRTGRTLSRFESGVWHPSKARGAADKYVQLARFVAGVVAAHAGPVLPRVVVEVPSGGIRPGRVHAMHGYHQAIGVILAGVCLAPVGAATGVEPVPVPVNTWKRTKRKEQTQREVQLELGYLAEDDNEADALGLACWFAHNSDRLHLIRGINESSGGAKIPKREAGPYARLRAVLRKRASR